MKHTVSFRKRLLALSTGLLWAATVSLTSLHAQTVSFAGMQTTVAGGIDLPLGVAADAAGDVFVADQGNGWIVKIAPNGVQTTVASGLTRPAGIALDNANDVFVADYMNNRVLKITSDGQQTTVGSGLNSPFGVAVDARGDVFIADSYNRRVVEVKPDGTQTTVPAVGLEYPLGVAVDGAGDVFIADYNTSNVVEVVAGGNTQVTVGSGLNHPSGVAVDAAGDAFIADTLNNRVIEVPAGGGPQTTVGSGLSGPASVAADGGGNVFIADTQHYQLVEVKRTAGQLPSANICPSGQASPSPCSQTATLSYNVTSGGTLGAVNVLTEGAPNLDFTLGGGSTCTGNFTAGQTCTVNVTFAPRFAGLRRGAVELVDGNGNTLATTYIYGTGTRPQIVFGSASQNAIVNNAQFLEGVAVDGSGNVFFTENQQVVKVTPGGAQSTLLSGVSAHGLTVDGAGNLFVAGTGSYSDGITEISPNGTQTQLPFFFYSDIAVAVDGAGNLYVADYTAVPAGNEILKIAPDGTETQIVSGLNGAFGLAVDDAGNIFVAETASHLVLKIAPDGSQTTVGSGFGATTGVAVDGPGDVLIVDGGNADVVKVSPDGTQSVIGSGFRSPWGIAVDASGNVYLTDQGYGQVVELPMSQPPALSFAATPMGSSSSDSPQSVTIQNIGNAALTATGLSVSANFAQVPGSGSPADCSASFSLAPGDSCNLSLSFTPEAASQISGSLILTDNAQNANPAMQSILLTGTGQLDDQTISFSPIATQISQTTISLTATASSGLPVTFTASPSGVCTVAGTTLTLWDGGTCNVTAIQAGDANYNAATSVVQSFTVLKAQPIVFPAPPAQMVGRTLQLSAQGGGSDLPVTFASLRASICAVTNSTATMLAAGSCSIQASQAGNSLYAAAAPVTVTFVVNPGAQTITFSGLPATATYGAGGPYTLNATASSGLAVSLSVTGPATLSGSTLTIGGAGTVVVTASQAGNSNYTAATSVSQTITVSQATATVTLSGLSQTYTGSALPVTATTNPARLTVNITYSGSTTPPTAVGIYAVAATINNTNYTGSASGTLVIGKATTAIAWATPAAITYGTPLGASQLNASSTVPGTFTYAPASGVVLNAGNQALSVTFTPTDSTDYSPAAASVVLVVKAASQAITFNAIATQPVGASVALNATASSGLAVSFASTTPAVCSVSGTTATTLDSGTCSIQATQPGNSNFAAASAVTQSFTVASASTFKLTATPGSETIKRGVFAGFLLEAVSVNGFSGNVNISCSGGPSDSVCGDFPQTVKLRSNGVALALSGVAFPTSTQPGAYIITFNKPSGSLKASTSATFTVK